jgi:hypothetical protein
LRVAACLPCGKTGFFIKMDAQDQNGNRIKRNGKTPWLQMAVREKTAGSAVWGGRLSFPLIFRLHFAHGVVILTFRGRLVYPLQ